MGFLNTFTNWRAERYEKHRSTMQAQGKCPDCNGRGFAMPPLVFDDVTPFDCPGCNGSGQYSDWEENRIED
ncbi:MAG TPA: methionine aminopeptidase [Bacillales bacterium]|nr:methionine aminopeptidase [Bacillales bacterium]